MKQSLYLLRRVAKLQEFVEEGEVETFSCKGKFNWADPFTKPVFEPTPFFLARRAQSIPDRDSFVHGAEALAKRLSQTQTVDR